MKKILNFFLVLAVIAIPLYAHAIDPLVTCTGTECGWKELMTMVNTVINFLLFYMAIPIAAIMFTYAGFMMITAAGGEAKTKGKTVFFNTVIGLLLALASWLIIKTILTIMGWEGSWIGF